MDTIVGEDGKRNHCYLS